MVRKLVTLCAAAVVGSASVAQAQATGTPSFNAPYRAFETHEFGATGSLVAFDNLAVEGQYRFGYRSFDLGARVGYLDAGGGSLLLGLEGRGRVLQASESFPLDGAIVAGLGTVEFDNLWVPVGLSLGRRVNLDGFSFVAYGQPTIGFLFDDIDANDTIQFGLGFGADFKLGESVDLRTSLGLFDIEGLAVSVVWVH